MKFVDDCDSILGLNTNLSLITNSPNRNLDTKMPPLKDIKHCPPILDLLIIGAGLAGVTLASRAWHIGYNHRNMAIIDTNTTFLQSFTTRTCNINQKVMRSPYKHHLAPMEDMSLSNFSRLHYTLLTSDERKQLKQDRLGERGIPPLDLFLNHTKEVIISHNLPEISYTMNVSKIYKEKNYWTVTDDKNNIRKAKYLILALGNKTQPIFLPQDVKIPYVNALLTEHETYCSKNIKNVCVVGSGNTAAHAIINAIQSGKHVTWILRNEEYYRCADIPHEFWRSEGISVFQKMPIEDRIKKFTDIYHGSAMPEHFQLFRKFREKGLLEVCEFDSIEAQEDKNILKLKSGKRVAAEIIVMANGISPNKIPTISPAIEFYNGFPILDDRSLEVKNSPNLYIASAQSALSLGPAAKNIDGMRLANERIFHSILTKENKMNDNISNLKKHLRWSSTGAITG